LAIRTASPNCHLCHFFFCFFQIIFILQTQSVLFLGGNKMKNNTKDNRTKAYSKKIVLSAFQDTLARRISTDIVIGDEAIMAFPASQGNWRVTSTHASGECEWEISTDRLLRYVADMLVCAAPCKYHLITICEGDKEVHHVYDRI
jgi:hypothetical protein